MTRNIDWCWTAVSTLQAILPLEPSPGGVDYCRTSPPPTTKYTSANHFQSSQSRQRDVKAEHQSNPPVSNFGDAENQHTSPSFVDSLESTSASQLVTTIRGLVVVGRLNRGARAWQRVGTNSPFYSMIYVVDDFVALSIISEHCDLYFRCWDLGQFQPLR